MVLSCSLVKKKHYNKPAKGIEMTDFPITLEYLLSLWDYVTFFREIRWCALDSFTYIPLSPFFREKLLESSSLLSSFLHLRFLLDLLLTGFNLNHTTEITSVKTMACFWSLFYLTFPQYLTPLTITIFGNCFSPLVVKAICVLVWVSLMGSNVAAAHWNVGVSQGSVLGSQFSLSLFLRDLIHICSFHPMGCL